MSNVCIWRELHHMRRDQVNTEGYVDAKKPRQPQTLLELRAPPPVVPPVQKASPGQHHKKNRPEIW